MWRTAFHVDSRAGQAIYGGRFGDLQNLQLDEHQVHRSGHEADFVTYLPFLPVMSAIDLDDHVRLANLVEMLRCHDAMDPSSRRECSRRPNPSHKARSTCLRYWLPRQARATRGTANGRRAAGELQAPTSQRSRLHCPPSIDGRCSRCDRCPSRSCLHLLHPPPTATELVLVCHGAQRRCSRPTNLSEIPPRNPTDRHNPHHHLPLAE